MNKIESNQSQISDLLYFCIQFRTHNLSPLLSPNCPMTPMPLVDYVELRDLESQLTDIECRDFLIAITSSNHQLIKEALFNYLNQERDSPVIASATKQCIEIVSNTMLSRASTPKSIIEEANLDALPQGELSHICVDSNRKGVNRSQSGARCFEGSHLEFVSHRENKSRDPCQNAIDKWVSDNSGDPKKRTSGAIFLSDVAADLGVDAVGECPQSHTIHLASVTTG